MRITKIGLCATALALGCQNEASQPTPATKADPAKATPVKSGESPQKETKVALAHQVAAPGLGFCAPSVQVETWGTRLIEHADSDRDGQVSKKEAQSFVNFLMGGFFFRADENSDGKVTPQEGRQARQEFAEKHPTIARLLRTAKSVKNETGKRPFVRLAEILDVDYPRVVSAKEVRDAAREALDDLYRAVDADEDQRLTVSEARNASVAGAAVLGHEMFAAADADSSGAVEFDELERAIDSGMKTAFNTADRNQDGKLTETEARDVLRGLASHLTSPPASAN